MLTAANDSHPISSALHRLPRQDGRYFHSKLRREWGDFLKGFGWAHFITFTPREPSSPDRLLNGFRGYIRSLERIAQCRVGWFVAFEEGDSLWGHLHALTAGTEHLTVACLDRQWRHGFTRIRQYDPRRGGAYYVVKEISSDERHHDSFDLSLPRRDSAARPTANCVYALI
jgi:hypothetical protein